MMGTDANIITVYEIMSLLEQLVTSKEPVLVIAKDVMGDTLSALVVNKIYGVLDVASIRAPGFGQRRQVYFKDTTLVTGSTYVAGEVGITPDTVTSKMLGTCERGRAASWPLACQSCRGTAPTRQLSH